MIAIRIHILILISAALFLTTPCFAGNDSYEYISKNVKIKQALDILASHNVVTYQTLNVLAGDNITNKSVKIKFWNLGELNYKFRKLDAITCRNSKGRIVILIDSEHKNAPPEAIASLLAHEALHQDQYTSYEEEIQAWTQEAKVWHSIKSLNPAINTKYAQTALVQRLNRIEKMHYQSANSNKEIIKAVYANNYYKNLPKYSPGFGI